MANGEEKPAKMPQAANAMPRIRQSDLPSESQPPKRRSLQRNIGHQTMSNLVKPQAFFARLGEKNRLRATLLFKNALPCGDAH